MTVENKISVCLNSGNFIENDTEIIINAAVMAVGVYNGKLKTAEQLKKSVRWWEGIPVVIENVEQIGDHPSTGITTAKTVRVGQVRNPTWNETQQRIDSDIHLIKEICPEWLQENARKREVKGVSGAYFCQFVQQNGELDSKKYDAIETDYVPNNLAIVKNPACKPPVCGLNVNSENDTMSESYKFVINQTGGISNIQYNQSDYIDVRLRGEKSGGDITMFFPRALFSKSIPFASIGIESDEQFMKVGNDIINVVANITNMSLNSEVNNMSDETITKEKLDLEIEKVKLSMNSEHAEKVKAITLEKDQVIATKDAEIVKLNSQIEGYKTAEAKAVLETKKTKFLAQFPEQNREKAAAELLPLFLEKPEELILNAAKVAELMVVDGKMQGKEFVATPVTNEEAELGLPKIEDVRKLI